MRKLKLKSMSALLSVGALAGLIAFVGMPADAATTSDSHHITITGTGTADIKAIQRMLGHGDARMTLNTYGHLYEDNLDSLMDAVEVAKKVELSNKSATILQF